MEEIWKDIKELEGLYQVSNLGNVRSMHFNRGNVIRNIKTYDNGGYRRILIRAHGKIYRFLVHRLVAEAFIPNPYSLPEVNHIDGNKCNNVVNNLEWSSRKDNIHHAIRTGLRPRFVTRQYHRGKLCNSSKAVLQFDIDGKLIRRYGLAKEAESYGFNARSIQRCCRNERKTHKGFVWKYE